MKEAKEKFTGDPFDEDQVKVFLEKTLDWDKIRGVYKEKVLPRYTETGSADYRDFMDVVWGDPTLYVNPYLKALGLYTEKEDALSETKGGEATNTWDGVYWDLFYELVVEGLGSTL